MKKYLLFSVVFAGTLLVLWSFKYFISERKPLAAAKGWYKYIKDDNAECGIDEVYSKPGMPAYCIRSVGNVRAYARPNFLHSEMELRRFAGHRIRFRAEVKTKGKETVGGLRLELYDFSGPGYLLSSDNMIDRGIQNQTEWKTFDLVADVPFETTVINYGGWLKSGDEMWFRTNGIEIVDSSVALTCKPPKDNRSFADQQHDAFVEWADWKYNCWPYYSREIRAEKGPGFVELGQPVVPAVTKESERANNRTRDKRWLQQRVVR